MATRQLPPVLNFSVEGRYATALYSAASKSNNLEVVEKDMLKVRDTYRTDEPLKAFCKDLSFQRSVKVVAIGNALKKLGVGEHTVNTFVLMAENGRLGLLEQVVEAFEEMMRGHRNEVFCVVTTAKQMDNASQREVTKVVETMLQPGQKLNLKLEVNSELIGGMIVRIGDKYLDMSIVKKIDTLERLIKEPA